VTYPSGATVTYAPDSAGRPVSATDSSNNIKYITSASYGPDSSITGFVSGNSTTFAGITSSFSYNKRLQPTLMSANAPNQTVFSIGYDFHLGNGDNGNVFSLINYRDQTRTQTFAYDALNRLTSALNAGTDCTKMTVNGKTEYWGNSYGYDAWGNLITKTPTKCSAENLSVTALANNQLSGYGYDAAGNMTHDSTTGNNYTYDAENRITGGSSYTYIYDADGNRVEKTTGGSNPTGTIYWYMSPGIVTESDLSGNPKSEYVFFDGERIARKDFPSGSVSYYFSDHLKTASVITDSAGNIKEDEDYYPWGGELQLVNSDSNHYKFTSKERDSETGLDYFGARYYGNWLGRWMSPDWAAKPETIPYSDLGDPQSLNLYSYVRNTPTTEFDADGHYQQRARSEEDLEREREEEKAEQELMGRIREAEARAAAAARTEADAKANREKREGYDDENGVCHVSGPAAHEVGPAGGGSLPKSEPPVFTEIPEFDGGKTIGLLGSPGKTPGIPIFSGVNGPAQNMPKDAPGFDIVSRTHVEGHVAALMRLSRINDATLRLNNPAICTSCLKNLPSMLPPGSTLRVVFPNGQTAVFQGNSR
jgi:RHS repeat-associated protein